MKQLRLTTAATVLTLTLSFSGFAGQMDTTLTSPVTAQSTATVAGDMETGVTATSSTSSTVTAVNSLTQVLLALLNLLPRI